ncbi:putative Lipoprotein [Pseudomonas coronafaciens pv. porri]|nr:putative lipoprotein [Pseudomonas coronafaciens pv. porri]RMS23142.1 putative Lipoprotein [Pseudomonas coronafaciens pv. garcae]RMV05834.1 putative Lipoprotein [Pseudomonas coronafaciens pv. coronafaciens]RMW05793.1 putative Lipoprotein [Pseudomonas coronafaciens pv. porri]
MAGSMSEQLSRMALTLNQYATRECMITRCLLIFMFLSLSGCWSLAYHLDGERCIYPGTRHGWAWGTKDVASTWPWLIDVPFSLALDTLLLPYDLTAFLPDNLGGDDRRCEFSDSLNVLG